MGNRYFFIFHYFYLPSLGNSCLYLVEASSLARIFASQGVLTRVFEHENCSAISLVERRFLRYFCLSTFSEINAEVIYISDLIDNWGLSADSASRSPAVVWLKHEEKQAWNIRCLVARSCGCRVYV